MEIENTSTTEAESVAVELENPTAEDTAVAESPKETETESDNTEEKGNLYDNTLNENPNAEIDYVNFEDEEFAEYKDIFKDSKISMADYEKFKAKIAEGSSIKAFTKDMVETFGENAPQVLKGYQELTDSIFTPEEKELLNALPSVYKTLMVKMGKALGDKQQKLMEDYGVLNQETQAIPETNRVNAEERFSMLTEKLLNGKLSPEEDFKIRQERLELAKYMK